jgi:putative oxidoreductase
MPSIITRLKLDFLPRNPDIALALLRVMLGTQMLLAHGWGKLAGYSELSGKFPDPLHVGSATSLALAIVGEVLCSALIMVGAFTRPAALGLMITMLVALFGVHGGKLTGEGNGELAFVYLVGFTAIFIAGAGRYSIDARLS